MRMIIQIETPSNQNDFNRVPKFRIFLQKWLTITNKINHFLLIQNFEEVSKMSARNFKINIQEI